MKKLYRNRLLAVAAIFAIFDFAHGAGLSFCKGMFGPKAQTSFEPKESNSGGVADNFLTGKATPIVTEGLPKPTGFVCMTEIYEPSKEKCPAGLRLDLKRSEIPSCVSKVFPLKNLCPDEIKEFWPDLKTEICKTDVKRKIKSTK